MNELKEFIRSLIVRLITAEAKAILRKYKPNIVIVTGSVGKTSSKDAAYTALSGAFFVRRSEKSFNSDIGVPLTILGVPNGWSNPFTWFKNLLEGLFLMFLPAPYPKWLVVEVGADRPGDISRSLSWLKPDAVLATRFPDVPVHVEFYKSPAEVVAEELSPVSWLMPGGVFVANADDPRAADYPAHEGVRKVTYGFSAAADVRGARYMVTTKNKMPTGIAFDISYGTERAHINLPGVIGRTHAVSALAGIAAAIAVGVPLSRAASGFGAHESPPGRTRLIEGKEFAIIDDTYNSSPVASEEALAALSDVPRTGKRVAILADMLELGSFSVDEHRRIGALAASSCDILITSGIRARDIADGARSAGMSADSVFECENNAAALEKAQSIIGEGDVVLVKGSQSMRMEKVVKGLMKDTAQAKKLLVRQNEEWGRR